MPKKKIHKSLQDYLSKIKNKNPHPQIQLPFNSLSSSKSWILRGCKHPKTSSFAIDRRNEPHDGTTTNNNVNNNHDEATLADIDRFLLENFRSLYLNDDKETDNNTKRVSEESHGEGPILFDSPSRFVDPPLDLRGSHRFFVSPGFSGSLAEDTANTGDEAGSSSTSTFNDSSSNFHCHRDAEEGADQVQALPDSCVAVLACSPRPYEDFQRSMQEIVEARCRNSERVDWDFLEELLFCYLNLNEKKSYKFILSAFVDLIVAMRRSSETTAPAKPRSVRTVRIGREVRKKTTKEVTLEFGSS